MGKLTKQDRKIIRDLAELLEETGLSEIEIKRFPGNRIRVSRHGGAAAPAAAPAKPPAEASDTPAPDESGAGSQEDYKDHPGTVNSPMVGTAFLAPEPGAQNFIEVGDTVSQGQTLLIIEAMKTMNPIPAPKAGKVAAIIAQNEQPVEYGDPLVVIE